MSGKGSGMRKPNTEVPKQVIDLRWQLAFGSVEDKIKAEKQLKKLGVV